MMKTLLPYLLVFPPIIYSLIALSAARSFFSRKESPPGFTPPLTIIKPLKGLDAESFANFASFCAQDYPEFQLLFCCAAADDPAIPVVRQLLAEFPFLDMELVVDGHAHGANAKVNNLINAWPKVKHDIIIVCDSDIRVKPDYLAGLAAGFADPQVGLVTSLYRSSAVHGVVTAVEALGFTVEMVPNVLVAERLEGLSFALGASMACRRAALEKIGGFAVLADYLADDYQLGNRIHEAGYRLLLSGHFVESVMRRESLAAILSRQLRWSRTIRVSRPAGYLASGLVQPFAAVVLVLVFAGFTPASAGALFVLYLLRFIVATIFSQLYVKDKLAPRYLWLLPVRDLLSLVVWGLAFAGNRVSWRGEQYLLGTDGKISARD
jgi:ceramide glucosyltransferase